MPNLIEIGLLPGEEDLKKKNFSVFLLFRDYLPFEKGNPLHLKNLESPLPKDE
jgi:hypothetical protein